MTEKVMELVLLENGDIVLRDADSAENEPLMKLSFSEDVNKLLKNSKLDIARAMLEAGIERHQEIELAKEQTRQEPKDSNLLH